MYKPKRGCQVNILSRNERNLSEWMRLTTGNKNINFIPLDFERLDQIRKFGEQLKDNFPDGIDLLINCAGICLAPLEDTSDNIERVSL